MLYGVFSTAPTGPPTSITTSSTPTTITVEWGEVECIHRNGDITGYSVRVVTSSEGGRVISVGDLRQATISGLSPFTEYIVSVAAVNNAGIGVYSNGATIRTKSEISSYNVT